IRKLKENLAEVKDHLLHLVDYAINHFEALLLKFGEGKERKTEIRLFDSVQRSVVAVANKKLYVDRNGGFIGFGSSLKKEEYICDCSDLDDIIVFLNDGSMKVTPVDEKTFVGKGIIHAAVWKKGDDRTTYHLIYDDKKSQRTYVKRFQVRAITRDREYMLTKSNQKGIVHYFSAQPNGEFEVVSVFLKPKPRLRKTHFDFDFKNLRIVGRDAGGNVLTGNQIKRVVQKSQGVSTLGGRDIWFDTVLFRLNVDGIGTWLGNFEKDDRILVLYEDGSYELTSFDLTNRYDGKGKLVEVVKLTPETVITAIYFEAQKKAYFLKRFQIETTTPDQRFSYISETKGSFLKFATTRPDTVVELSFAGRKKPREINLDQFIDVKGWKAVGNKIADFKLKSITVLQNNVTSSATEVM
ncbi:DNA gyrase/topoisomerase IV subunit A, partial [candidate division CSSED10-310 bacterium]